MSTEGFTTPSQAVKAAMASQEPRKYELLITFKNSDEQWRYTIEADLQRSEVFDFANPTFAFTTTDNKRVLIASSEVREVVLVELPDGSQQ